MDTMAISFQRSSTEKTATSVAGIAILLVFIVTQIPIISAKDSDIGKYTGLSPAINYIQEQAELELRFNKEIKNKYLQGKIVDVEKGVKHIKLLRYYNGRPVRINIIELSKDVNNNLEVMPSIASNTLASRSKISNIAQREHAIAAINGGYFKPQTGVPLGTLMINKKVYTGPIYDRVALGIFDNGYGMARVQLKANLLNNKNEIKVDNVNQPRMLSTHTLVYTPDWGSNSPLCPKYGKAVAVENGEVIAESYGSLSIPENGFVVVAPEKIINQIDKSKKLKLNIKMNPEWNGVNHIIGGGPYLIKNNEIYVDMTAQKLSAIGGRNPRTAIGYTKDNHLIMMTADGREGSSIGLTLYELAELMKEFGCINAMNLDGGGSTVMYVNGYVVNKPAMQGGIPLSHTLTITQKRFS
ncbi:MAG: phosphodiester glycosidase family protein [bacterium]|nr:phosphodiester glycosidase family protein [bacterium]